MRSTTSAGASRKATAARHSSACNRSLFGGENDLTLGVAYSNGKTTFDSALEVASLLENRATTRTGIFAQEFATAVGSELTSASAVFPRYAEAVR